MEKYFKVRISKSNRRGLLLLGIITLGIIFFPRVVFMLTADQDFQLSTYEMSILNNWEATKKKRIQRRVDNYKRHYNIPAAKFNPNTYSERDWQLLGLSPKQAAVVVKFCSKGIHSNADLKKIYVLSDEFYALIKDSTYYSEIAITEVEASQPIEKQKKHKIELNTATEEDLLSIRGIGPFFAKNIIKKRDELGGFSNKLQLLEIWKFDKEKFDEIQENLTIDLSKLNTLSINTATIEELKKHPYIRWHIANSIVKMRVQRGRFTELEELKDSELISNEKFEQIKPYLTL